LKPLINQTALAWASRERASDHTARASPCNMPGFQGGASCGKTAVVVVLSAEADSPPPDFIIPP
jgi:hypothetical protein